MINFEPINTVSLELFCNKFSILERYNILIMRNILKKNFKEYEIYRVLDNIIITIEATSIKFANSNKNNIFCFVT